MVTKRAFIFLVALGISGISVYAKSKSQTGTSSVSMNDAQFLRKAAEGGMAEVQMGQLAQEKASNKDVKDFGKHMVDDHSKANDELKSLASQKNVTVPDSLSAKDKATYDRLSKLSGDQFDREYMRVMVKDHETDVAEFRRESKTAKDPDVRSFASKTLPTLEEHLKMARDIAAKVGAVTSKETTKGHSARKY